MNEEEPKSAIQDNSRGFLQYIKERHEARDQLKEKNSELLKVKGQLYEYRNKIEALENQIKDLKKSIPKPDSRGQPIKSVTASNGNDRSQQAKNTVQSRAKEQNVTKVQKMSKTPKKGTRHPIIPGRESVANDSMAFYQAVAEQMPKAKFSTIIQAEKLFLEGDLNGDGVIDVDELDKLFTKHNGLYTMKQVEEVLNTIDKDGSNTLDFIEVLQVMHQMEEGSKTNLPPNIVTKNSKGTAVCLVQ